MWIAIKNELQSQYLTSQKSTYYICLGINEIDLIFSPKWPDFHPQHGGQRLTRVSKDVHRKNGREWGKNVTP